jgi:hypothetical protein
MWIEVWISETLTRHISRFFIYPMRRFSYQRSKHTNYPGVWRVPSSAVETKHCNNFTKTVDFTSIMIHVCSSWNIVGAHSNFKMACYCRVFAFLGVHKKKIFNLISKYFLSSRHVWHCRFALKKEKIFCIFWNCRFLYFLHAHRR